MKRKRFTKEHITPILKAHKAGARVPDLARRHGVAENSIYRWKSKFGGLEVSEAKRLRDLEAENSRLKNLVALHGGTLSIESEPGCGTRATFDLPPGRLLGVQ